MNYYKYDNNQDLKKLCGKKLDYKHIIDSLIKYHNYVHGQSDLLDLTEEDLLVTDYNIALDLWEYAAISRSVTIHVTDHALIEMLLRVSMEGKLEDLRVPFPICEFVFPKGIKMESSGLELPGALLATSEFDLEGFWDKYTNDQGILNYCRKSGGKREDLFVMTVNKETNQRITGAGAVGYDLNHGVQLTQELSDVEVDLGLQVRDLIFALCLYLQTKEGYNALIPRKEKKRRPDTPAAIGRIVKKRPQYHIKDLITPKYQQECNELGGHHASPKAHWRRMHLRTLRSERYKRNPDGSVRAVWVSPSLINPPEDDEIIEQHVKV